MRALSTQSERTQTSIRTQSYEIGRLRQMKHIRELVRELHVRLRLRLLLPLLLPLLLLLLLLVLLLLVLVLVLVLSVLMLQRCVELGERAREDEENVPDE